MDIMDELQYRALEAWYDRTIDQIDRDFVADMTAERERWEADMIQKTSARFADMETELRQQIIGGSVQSASEQQPASGVIQQQADTNALNVRADDAGQTEITDFYRSADSPINNDNIATGICGAHTFELQLPTEAVNVDTMPRSRTYRDNVIVLRDESVQTEVTNLNITDEARKNHLATSHVIYDSGTAGQSTTQAIDPHLSIEADEVRTDQTSDMTMPSKTHELSLPTQTSKASNKQQPDASGGNADFMTHGIDQKIVVNTGRESATGSFEAESTSDGEIHSNQVQFQHAGSLSEAAIDKYVPHYDTCDDGSFIYLGNTMDDFSTCSSVSELTPTINAAFISGELENNDTVEKTVTKTENEIQTPNLPEMSCTNTKPKCGMTLRDEDNKESIKSHIDKQPTPSFNSYQVNVKPQRDSLVSTVTGNNEIERGSTTQQETKSMEPITWELHTPGQVPGNILHPIGGIQTQRDSLTAQKDTKPESIYDVYNGKDIGIHTLDFSSDEASRSSNRSVSYYSRNLSNDAKESNKTQRFPEVDTSESQSSPYAKVLDITGNTNSDISNLQNDLGILKTETIMEIKMQIQETKYELQNEREMKMKETRANISKELEDFEKKMREEAEEHTKRNMKKSEENVRCEVRVFEKVKNYLEEYKEKLEEEQREMQPDQELRIETAHTKIYCQTINCKYVTINQQGHIPVLNSSHGAQTHFKTQDQFSARQTSSMASQRWFSSNSTLVENANPSNKINQIDDAGVKIRQMKQNLFRYDKRGNKYKVRSEDDGSADSSLTKSLKKIHNKQAKKNKPEFSDIIYNVEDNVVSSDTVETMSDTTLSEDLTLNYFRTNSENPQQIIVPSGEFVSTQLSEMSTENKYPSKYDTGENKMRQMRSKYHASSTKSDKAFDIDEKPEKPRRQPQSGAVAKRSHDQTKNIEMMDSNQEVYIRQKSELQKVQKEKPDMKVDHKSAVKQKKHSMHHITETKKEHVSPIPTNIQLAGRNIKPRTVSTKEEVGISDKIKVEKLQPRFHSNLSQDNAKFEEKEQDNMRTEPSLISTQLTTKEDLDSVAQTSSEYRTDIQTALLTGKKENLSRNERTQSIVDVNPDATKKTKKNSTIDLKKLNQIRVKEKRNMEKETLLYPEMKADTKVHAIASFDVNRKNEASRSEMRCIEFHQITRSDRSNSEISERSETTDSSLLEFVKHNNGNVEPSTKLRTKRTILPIEDDIKVHQKKVQKGKQPCNSKDQYKTANYDPKDRLIDPNHVDKFSNFHLETRISKKEDCISPEISSPLSDSSISSVHGELFDRSSTSRYTDCLEKEFKRKRKSVHKKEYDSDSEENDNDKEIKRYHKRVNHTKLLQSGQLSRSERTMKEKTEKIQMQLTPEQHDSYHSTSPTSNESEHERKLKKANNKRRKEKKTKVESVENKQSDTVVNTDVHIVDSRTGRIQTQSTQLSDVLSKMNAAERWAERCENASKVLEYEKLDYENNTVSGKKTTRITHSKRSQRTATDKIYKHEKVVSGKHQNKSEDTRSISKDDLEVHGHINELYKNVEDNTIESNENLSTVNESLKNVTKLPLYESQSYSSDITDTSSCSSQDNIYNMNKIKRKRTPESELQGNTHDDIAGFATVTKSQSTSDKETISNGISHDLTAEDDSHVYDDNKNECEHSEVAVSTENDDMKSKSVFPLKIKLRTKTRKTKKKEKNAKRKEKQKEKELRKLDKEIEMEKKKTEKIDLKYERKQRKLEKKEEKKVLKEEKKRMKEGEKSEKIAMKQVKKMQLEEAKKAKKTEKEEKKLLSKVMKEAKKAEKEEKKIMKEIMKEAEQVDDEQKKLEKIEREKQKKILQKEQKQEKEERKLEKRREKIEQKEQSKETKLIKKREKEILKLELEQMKHEKKMEAMKVKALKQKEKDDKKWEETEKKIAIKEEMKQIKKEQKLEKERWKLIEKRDKFVLRKEKSVKSEEFKRKKKELVQMAKQGLPGEKSVAENKSETEKLPNAMIPESKRSMQVNETEKLDTTEPGKSELISSLPNSLNKALEYISYEPTLGNNDFNFQSICTFDDKEPEDDYDKQEQQGHTSKINLVLEMQKRNIHILESESDQEISTEFVTNELKTTKQKKCSESRNIQYEKETKETDDVKRAAIVSDKELPERKCNARCNYSSWDEDSSDEEPQVTKSDQRVIVTDKQEKNVEFAKTSFRFNLDERESKEVEFVLENGYNSWDDSDKEEDDLECQIREIMSDYIDTNRSTKPKVKKQCPTINRQKDDIRDRKELPARKLSTRESYQPVRYRVQEEKEFTSTMKKSNDSEKEDDDLERQIREILDDDIDTYESIKPKVKKQSSRRNLQNHSRMKDKQNKINEMSESKLIPVTDRNTDSEQKVNDKMSLKLTSATERNTENTQTVKIPENFHEDKVITDVIKSSTIKNKTNTSDVEIVKTSQDDDSFISSWSSMSDLKDDIQMEKSMESTVRNPGPVIVNGESKKEKDNKLILVENESSFTGYTYDPKDNISGELYKQEPTDSDEAYDILSEKEQIYEEDNLEAQKLGKPSSRVDRIANLKAEIRALKGKPPKLNSSEIKATNFVKNVKVKTDKAVGITAARLASKYLKGIEQYRNSQDDFHQQCEKNEENKTSAENLPEVEAHQSQSEPLSDHSSSDDGDFEHFTRVRHFDSDTSLDEDNTVKRTIHNHNTELESDEKSNTCVLAEDDEKFQHFIVPGTSDESKNPVLEQKYPPKKSFKQKLRYQIDKRMGNMLSKIATSHLERYMNATTESVDAQNKGSTRSEENIDNCQEESRSNVDLQSQSSDQSTTPRGVSNEMPTASAANAIGNTNADKKKSSKKSLFSGLFSFKKYSKEEKQQRAEAKFQNAQRTLAEAQNKLQAIQTSGSNVECAVQKSDSNMTNTEDDYVSDKTDLSMSNSVTSSIDRFVDRKDSEKYKTEMFIAQAKVLRAAEEARHAEKKAAKYREKVAKAQMKASKRQEQAAGFPSRVRHPLNVLKTVKPLLNQ